jgi:phosphate transport system substrate-binding protein
MKAKKILKTVLIAVFIAVFFMLICTSCGRSEANVIIAGSTSVQPYAEILAEEYALIYPEKKLDVQGGGSSAGITAAESGTAHIGMSSRNLKENERLMWHIEIARDGLSIIIHPDNPVQNLTLEQVCGIYTGSITNWSEVGGHDARIHIITREEGSGTRGAFEDLVMGSEFITPKAIVQDSNGSVRQIVSGDKNSVGFISLGLADSSVKAVSLNGIAPTSENVANGTYMLFRPFIFICASEPEGLTKQFIDFTISRAGQQILMDEGLVPLGVTDEEGDNGGNGG